MYNLKQRLVEVTNKERNFSDNFAYVLEGGSMRLQEQRVFRFGHVEVDPSQRSLRRDGTEQHLRPQAFQVLLYLIENRERVVTKQELVDRVWRVVSVTDDALVQAVGDIRKAVGDDPRKPQWIKTVSKSGYRFIGEVEEIDRNGSSTEEIEVTTLEVEVEDEIEVHEPEKQSAIVVAQPSLNSRLALPSTHRSTVIAGILLVAVAAISLYVAARFSRSQKETSVLQVPGKKSVVVFYFHNQSGNRELEWLRTGLADMLITGLSRSQELRLLSRQQLHLFLDRIGHPQSQEIRFDETLEIARRSKAEVAVTGSFARVGRQTRIDVQLHDVRTAQLLAAEQVRIEEPEQILAQVDFLSLKLASHLGASPENRGIKTKLTDAMTTNLEAFRYYSIALEKAYDLHSKEAVELLEKAITLDPQFAMAHARLGYVYAVSWSKPETARPHLEKAFRLIDRLTEKDRLNIAAWYAIANHDFAAAAESYREIIAKYPMEVEAYVQFARLLESEGQIQQAIEVLKRGFLADPESKLLHNRLGTFYSAMGRHDDAIATHRRYVDLALTEPNAHDSLGLSYQWAGRYDEAIEEFKRAMELNPRFEIAVVHLGNVYFQVGRYQEALHEYERYISIAPSDAERARGYSMIAHVHWNKGNVKLAGEAARKELESFKDHFGTGLMIAIKRADAMETAALRERFSPNRIPANRGVRLDLRMEHYYRGLMDLNSGNPTNAIHHFKKALEHHPTVWHVDAYEDCLANAYLQLGRLDEAITEYERILRLNAKYPLAHYHLAQAYERKGMQDRARDAYQQFLQVWKHADRDLPEIKIARQKLT